MNKKEQVISDIDASRRNFLAGVGGLAGTSWLALNAPALMAAAEAAGEQQSTAGAWVNISAVEAMALAAVVDQIIPPDDLPGASEIGVVFFIDQALGSFMAEASVMIKEGLIELDTGAREMVSGSDGFADLSFEQQTGLLQEIETTPFFSILIFLTHLGMFAMPSWGGNRGKAGWDLLGFDSQHAWQPPFGYYDAQVAAENKNHGE